MSDETNESRQPIDTRRPGLNITRLLPVPNEYTLALDNEYRHVAFNEERAPLNRGLWRKQVFQVSEEVPVDLEIGTGNGKHFQHRSLSDPNRCILGVEVKYKPLIQTIRGAIKKGAKNAAVARYHAMNLDLLIEPQEVNNVYIHFPDPWVTPRKPQNRFVNEKVLNWLFEMQRPGSFLEFKTDSREYFLWSLPQIESSKYQVIHKTLDLHKDGKPDGYFITQFESIFMRQQVPINYIKLLRP